jgi:predicted CXXCH cytochrome family protein
MRPSIIIPRMLGLVGFILVAVGALVGSAQIFAQTPPTIPHTLEGRDNCLACHETGVAGAPQYPENHAGRTNDMCQMCHQPGETQAEPAPVIPHELEGRDDCTACHQPGHAETQSDEQAVQPTPTAVPPPTPIAYPELEGDTSTCVDCHQALGGRSEQVVSDWQMSIHAERDVICADCHGGDPNADTVNESMSPDAGYIGAPDRTEIPEVCGSCHADVTLMRQYDLPTDQLAKYRESIHGQRLAEGDTKVATCYDCHDEHATYETNDLRSHVYRLNVPALCAGCHADEEYMADYNIPTNQYALYETSVHGIALLEEQNTRSPSCATCHGTHGAAPPGFTEVANVCGNCHDATQNYFLSGAHNSDNPDSPICVTCHGRYDVYEPSDAMYIGDEPRHCGSCHEPDSEIGSLVNAIHESLVDANAAYEDAENTVSKAADLGMIVTDEENLLAEARTKLITARAQQHSVNLSTVSEASEESMALSKQAKDRANDAIDESRFRRRAMVIAVAIIGLIVLSLILIRRELG